MIDEEMITAASDVIHDYYGMEIPYTLLKCALEENPGLTQEAKDGGSSDQMPA